MLSSTMIWLAVASTSRETMNEPSLEAEPETTISCPGRNRGKDEDEEIIARVLATKEMSTASPVFTSTR